MSKTFRPWKIDQPLMFPACVQDFVGEDHLARFVVGLVLDHLDLGAITGSYGSECGQPPFDPAMMTALLLYAYCNAREDKAFGRDKSGEEMPDWVADKKKRAEKIRAAQAELEAEAKAAAASKAKAGRREGRGRARPQGVGLRL